MGELVPRQNSGKHVYGPGLFIRLMLDLNRKPLGNRFDLSKV